MAIGPFTTLSGIQIEACTAFITSSTRWEQIEDELASHIHPADFWKSASALLTIAEVREFQLFSSKTPVGDWKIACIRSADALKKEVANALLKLIEEPPSYLYLIFLAETPHFLPTVRSRLRIVELDGGEGNGLSRPWVKVLSAYDSSMPSERKVLSHLLYWYPLVHPSVKIETVLDPFSS